MAKKKKEFFPMYNIKEHNYEVHCRDGCLIDELPSFDCARYISELACMGHIWLNGDEIRITKETEEMLIAQANVKATKPIACPPKSMIGG